MCVPFTWCSRFVSGRVWPPLCMGWIMSHLSVGLRFYSHWVQKEAIVTMINVPWLAPQVVSVLPGRDRHTKHRISDLNPEIPGVRLAGQPVIWDFWPWPAGAQKHSILWNPQPQTKEMPASGGVGGVTRVLSQRERGKWGWEKLSAKALPGLAKLLSGLNIPNSFLIPFAMKISMENVEMAPGRCSEIHVACHLITKVDWRA